LNLHTFEEKEKCYSITSTYEIQIRMGVFEVFRLENCNCWKEKSFWNLLICACFDII